MTRSNAIANAVVALLLLTPLGGILLIVAICRSKLISGDPR